MCSAIDNAINKTMEQAVQKGIEIGEERLGKLLIHLYELNMYDEVDRACRDKAYRYDLYNKFHIV